MYPIAVLDTLNLHNVRYQLYLNKAGGVGVGGVVNLGFKIFLPDLEPMPLAAVHTAPFLVS